MQLAAQRANLLLGMEADQRTQTSFDNGLLSRKMRCLHSFGEQLIVDYNTDSHRVLPFLKLLSLPNVPHLTLSIALYHSIVQYAKRRRSFHQRDIVLMRWEEIRGQYPEQWLLLEAIAAHSENHQRILDQLAVIRAYPDSQSAMREYAQLHHRDPQCELYVLHTSRENIVISERYRFGVRIAS